MSKFKRKLVKNRPLSSKGYTRPKGIKKTHSRPSTSRSTKRKSSNVSIHSTQGLSNSKTSFKKNKYEKKSGKPTHEFLEQQRLKISKLRKDNEILMKKIDQYREKSKTSNEISTKMKKLDETINSIILKIENYKKMVLNETKYNDSLEKQIKSEKLKFGVKKNQFLVVNKQIKILENRLELNLKLLNSKVCDNMKIRSKITKYRNEKISFNKIYKKIEKELFEKQKMIAEVIENSNKEYEERDSILMEIKKIESKKGMKMWEFKQKLKELNKIISKNEMFNGKNQTVTVEKVKKIKKKGSLAVENWDKMTVNTKDKCIKLQNKFKKIKKETGKSVDELIDNLVEISNVNFSKFNYINKLSEKNEKIEKNIMKLDAQIKYQKLENEKQKEMKKEFEILDEKIKMVENRCGDFKNKIVGLKGVYKEKIFPKISVFLKKLNVEEKDKVVDFKSLLFYTGKIEEKLFGLIDEDIEIGPKSEKLKKQIKIVPPSIEDISDDIFSNEKPLDEKNLVKNSKRLIEMRFFNKKK